MVNLTSYYAHSPADEQENWEPLSAHLEAVAKKTEIFASHFNFKKLGKFAGYLHDLGKYQASFQKRIRGENISVEHSACGAKEALAMLAPDKATPINLLNREIVAYIIAGHHSGLPNCGTEADDSMLPTLNARLKRQTEDYSFYRNEMKIVLDSAHSWIGEFASYSDKEKPFALSILTRMLFSALVDADSLETERFYKGERSLEYDSFNTLKKKLDKKILRFPPADKDSINEKRSEILNMCIDKAEGEKGVFSLTVPTGGGKTLSSMAFALHHLLKRGHRRIIYVIPYTAIITQTSKVFAEIFGKENILVHHSNANLEDDNTNEDTPKSSATENWDAPIILTTNVQFFESLFSSKRGNCRKLHNISNSVIIFDEAQMLPIPLLKPCLKAVDVLTRNFNSTALLMSATCPDFLPYMCNGANITEINDNYRMHYKDFKRVTAKYLGKQSDVDLVGRLNSEEQALIVVNTRKHARELFEKLSNSINKYHLSTLMYSRHRKIVLDKIQDDLSKDRPCTVVSTQLIECGVDMDFENVYRSLAGIDSIVQAGGRCNREGKGDNAIVYIFEGEKDPTKGDIPIYKSLARPLCENPKDGDIFSLGNINSYFEHVLSFYDKETDKKNILDMFKIGNEQIILRFDFAECNKKFNYIDSANKYDIIMPADSTASSLINSVRNSPHPSIEIFRNLGSYSVSVYEWEYAKLKKENKISRLLSDNDKFYVLNSMDDYDSCLGLKLNFADMSVENLIF